MKEHWDPSKTPSENLKGLGLCAEPNTSNDSDNTNKQQQQVVMMNVNGEVDDDSLNEAETPQSDNGQSAAAAAKPAAFNKLFIAPKDIVRKERPFPMSVEDETYAMACLEKHGVNYTAMFRDTRTVNAMQYTKAQLQKMCTKCLRLQPSQRRMEDVPETVRVLMKEAANL